MPSSRFSSARPKFPRWQRHDQQGNPMTAEEAHPRPSSRPSRPAGPVEEPPPATPVLLKPWLSSQSSRFPRFTSRPSFEASNVRRHERRLLELREPIEEDFGRGQRRSRRTVRDHGLLQCPLGIVDRCQGLHWLRGVVAARPAQCGDCRPTQPVQAFTARPAGCGRYPRRRKHDDVRGLSCCIQAPFVGSGPAVRK